MSQLAVVVPSIRGMEALPAIESALKQRDFDKIKVIIAGKSCEDVGFINRCHELSEDILTIKPLADGKSTPGQVRNQCLHVLGEKVEEYNYVLFLDDDIVVPEDFAAMLVNFLRREKPMVAAMGRVVSSPRNYWTKIIDYSNFWWLQVEKDITDLTWLGAGATLVPSKAIQGMIFDESLRINEDTDFFRRLAEKDKGRLGVCAATTCYHNHARDTFKEFIKYQFSNGKLSIREFHSSKVSLRSLVIGFRNILSFFKKALLANGRYLIKRPHVLLGVLVSIIIYELGIQRGISQLNQKK
jgi:GT2 family glycosyltransferase